MSIASEIERIQNAKTSIKTAIENEGVEVGNGTIDTYADKIIEISSSKATMEDGLVSRQLAGEYTNNRVIDVGMYAFRGTAITKFNSTSAQSFNTYSFYSLETLEECNAPNITLISGISAFYGCTKLKKINFPLNASGIGTSTFQNCTSLSYANIGEANWISANAFNGCSSLKTLIITRKNYFPSLSNINSFAGTPIEDGTGYIYVDDDVYEMYLTATNWSTYANQIRRISELPEGVEL